VAQLERAGLRDLFARGPVAFRRVDRVTPRAVEVGGVLLPRAAVAGPLVEGQWLRFERRGEVVDLRVDLRATLEGERRFSTLLSSLAPGGRPLH
jgi:hypothetical protein